MFSLEFGWEVGVAFLAVIVLMVLPHASRKIYGPVDYIKTDELNRMLKAGEPLRVLDLRSRKEFLNYRIAEAIYLPPAKIDHYLIQTREDADSSAPVILVCASDLDSIRMVSRFRKHGVKNVKVMQGGMFRWKRDGLPVKRD